MRSLKAKTTFTAWQIADTQQECIEKNERINECVRGCVREKAYT